MATKSLFSSAKPMTKSKKTYWTLIGGAAALGVFSLSGMIISAFLWGTPPQPYDPSADSMDSLAAVSDENAAAPQKMEAGEKWRNRTGDVALAYPLTFESADKLIDTVDEYNKYNHPDLKNRKLLIKDVREVKQEKPGKNDVKYALVTIGFEQSDVILNAQLQNEYWQVWEDHAGEKNSPSVTSAAAGNEQSSQQQSSSAKSIDPTVDVKLSDVDTLLAKKFPRPCAKYLAPSFSKWAGKHGLSSDQSDAKVTGELTCPGQGQSMFYIVSHEGVTVSCVYDQAANTLEFNKESR